VTVPPPRGHQELEIKKGNYYLTVTYSIELTPLFPRVPF